MWRWEYGRQFLGRREIRKDGTRREEKEIMGLGGDLPGNTRRGQTKSRTEKKSQKDFNNINNCTSEIVWQQAAHLFYH